MHYLFNNDRAQCLKITPKSLILQQTKRATSRKILPIHANFRVRFEFWLFYETFFGNFQTFWPFFPCLVGNQARADSNIVLGPIKAEKDAECAEWGVLIANFFSGRVLHLFIQFPRGPYPKQHRFEKLDLLVQNSKCRNRIFHLPVFFSDQKFQMRC